MERQRRRILDNPGSFGDPIVDALSNHERHAALGAIGPDMIFWADWGGLTPVVNELFDIYKTLDNIYEELAAIWQPIGDAIDKVVDTLSGGLAGEINETLALLRGIIESALLDLITTKIDVLG